MSKSTEVPRSLKNIFDEVQRDYPNGPNPKRTLESWARQGVFLLNTALTVEDGDFNSSRQDRVEKSSDHSCLGKVVR